MINSRGPLGAKYSERGPEAEETSHGPAHIDPTASMNDGQRRDYYAERHKAQESIRQQIADSKARALDDALCQAELARSGRSILACQFIRDSAKVQGVTLREFINREIP